MKKILILFLIISLSACSKENLKDEAISKHTENAMLNKEFFLSEIYEEETQTEESKEPELEETEITNRNTSSVEIKTDNNSEYLIHKGRIDCQEIDECLAISTSIQKEFRSIIKGSNYLPVRDNNAKLLGYFIVYYFKNATISTAEECHDLGAHIMEKLSDRITKYECKDNTLAVTTDYGGHNET